MLTYKSHYNIASSYLCEMISKKKFFETLWGTDSHQLIMPQIINYCWNTFLERSFNYAAPCEMDCFDHCSIL